MKKLCRWVYDWITVLTASLVGLPSLLLQLLNYVGYVDLTPFVGPEKALKIITTVALVKGLLAFLESQFKGSEE